jgi:hypothetical protein
MSTTVSQDNAFVSSIISRTLLEESIDWIKDNLEPEDVFDYSTLEGWVIDHVEVSHFPEDELREWAEANGYTKPE